MCVEMYEQAEWTKKVLMEMSQVANARCHGKTNKVGHHEGRAREFGDHVENISAVDMHVDDTRENCHGEGTDEARHVDDHLAMFEKVGRKEAQRRRRLDDSDDEGEEKQRRRFACQMAGQQWNQFPSPVVVDSGVCASVMPKECCGHVPWKPTPQSKTG